MREIEGRIERLGAQGDGIMESPAGRCYVPYTVPGDRVMVRLGRPKGDGIAAQLREVLEPGPDRVEPPCPHFHACGGCALQHLADPAYAAWKRDLVVRALARHGLGEVEVAPLVRTAPGSRRRADFVARRVGAAVLLGFHEAESRRIVDLQTCLVLAPELVALMAPLRAALAPLLRPGQSLDARATLTESGIDLALVSELPADAATRAGLADFAAAADLARLALLRPDGEGEDVVVRRTPLLRFGDVPVTPPAGGFVQASAAAEAALVAEVLAGVGEARRVADLYAGCGTFSFPLAARAKVHAVEGDRAALAALQAAAIAAGLAGRVNAERRDLARSPLAAAELDRFDAVVFDPPRAGAREQAAELARSKVPAVVGVSCSPASFARDAALLAAGGYRLMRLAPVDQFLWTPHVELVGTFRR